MQSRLLLTLFLDMQPLPEWIRLHENVEAARLGVGVVVDPVELPVKGEGFVNDVSKALVHGQQLRHVFVELVDGKCY